MGTEKCLTFFGGDPGNVTIGTVSRRRGKCYEPDGIL